MAPGDIAANNADVKAKLEGQDINGQRNAPDDNLFGNTGEALDNLRKEVAKPEDEAPADDKTVVQPKGDDEKAKAEAASTLDKSASDKPVSDKPAAEAPKGDDPFKDISLPPGARPKSGEAFGILKEKAKQEIESREKEIARLKSEVESRDAKLKDPVPAELQAELKTLREFRAKFDIEADPKFASFDQTAEQAREFIYSQLKQNPNLASDTVDLIKKYGGPENVKMEKIFEAMQDSQAAELIKSQLSAIALAKFNKEQAQNTAKKNVAAYIQERQQEFEKGRTSHNDSTKAELSKLREQLPWMAKQTADNKATDEQKKAVEGHNAFVEDVNKQLEAAIQDDTPHMRAVMLAGMAQLFFVRNRYTELKAHAEALEKSNSELTTKLEKFKGASVSRLDKSAAAKDGTPALKSDKETDIFSQRAGDALDSIRARVLQEQARANA